MRSGMAQILKDEGFSVQQASDGDTALKMAGNIKPNLIIADYRMPGMNGLELLNAVKTSLPDTEVIIITAFGTIDVAVKAMQQGAWDFITKPFSAEELSVKVNRTLKVIRQRIEADKLKDENRYLRQEADIRFNYGEIIGESREMKKVYKTIEKVAKNNTSVLILGESGTGKELAARAIHFNSLRKEQPFIKVNCGALAQGVLESELFGHEKGAFTGAIRMKKGRFELADHGTLFLDEIGDLPAETQVKLLRVLQEKEFERVGGENTISVDVRIIAATNLDLKEQIRKGKFREDLYYRLYILPIHLPPLRERKEDIPVLAGHFIDKIGKETGNPGITITEDAVGLLVNYNWPGNVRELQNIIERALVLCEHNRITADDLSFISSKVKDTSDMDYGFNLEETISGVEKDMIKRALKQCRGVKAKAAKLLRIKESTLYYKMEKYKIPLN
ncbi:sigma-54-dependent Fis family transcriptional regulator [bacterium]|nr:sigma-54-dependent Fis family transcriptional regulator [bacterium]